MNQLLNYDTYLASKHKPILTVEEAEKLYQNFIECTDLSDAFMKKMIDDLLRKCVEYAHIRMNWKLCSLEERSHNDKKRTVCHDALIASFNAIARLQERTTTCEWREMLGDERKRIGDFACYIAYMYAINSR